MSDNDLKKHMTALEVVIFNLEGVLHDLTHQFNPNDGGVCARTISRAIKTLSELEGADNATRGPTND